MSDGAIALFGGSFNPPHLGHLGVCEWVLANEPGKLWILPAHVHPFGKTLAPFEDRLRMCELLVEDVARANAGRLRVRDIERDVPTQTGWTIDTIRYLRERYPGERFRLVLGSDLLDERDRWKDFEALEQLAPPIWVPRRGFDDANRALDVEPFLADIRSVDIRRRLAAGKAVDDLVGQRVAAYVADRHVYGEDA